MRILEKYTGDRTYMFPSGRLATKEAMLEQFPAALKFTNVIETDENHEVIFAFNNLSVLRSVYRIDPMLSEEAAIQKIQELLNENAEVREESAPSAEERIASALEYQVLSSMPDDETV